ncbi:hypothetical protein GCM10027217_10950 [Pseudomaricurvus hydrocarbonicus]
MRLEGGSTFIIRGTSDGGDADTFLLLSENGSAPKHVKIQAKYGNILIEGTTVSSWDPAANGPDVDSSNGRAYIHVNSIESNVLAQESRMDISNSEVSYLGFHDSESYGLVWKVRGGDSDETIYDRLEVYGDIVNSYIHHNYMGMYTFGSYGMTIENNEFSFNESYGIDPHDDSDWLQILSNDVHDNENHGIICSKRCNNLLISGNVSYRNRHGIMLHRDTNDSVVENNTVYDNRENGIAVFESHNNIIKNNTVTGNRHGIRLSLGSHDNIIENNIIEDNVKNGAYFYSGSDLPATTNGRPADNIFRYNTFSNNGRLMKIRDSDNIVFKDNIFDGPTDVELYDSSNLEIVGNTHLFSELSVRLDGSDMFPSDVVFEIDENTNVKLTDYATVILINHNGRILDPEESAGVVTATYDISDGTPRTTTILELTSSIIGSSTDVTALPFWVSLASGEIAIRSPDFTGPTKSWKAASASDSVQTDFKVTGMEDGVLYEVFKDNAPFTEVTATAGEIVFSDIVTSAEAEYAVLGHAVGLPFDVYADTHVRDGLPDTNYGDASIMEVKMSGADYIRYGLLMFDVSTLTAPVSSATLVLNMELSRAGSVTTQVRAVEDEWLENSVTWNNFPTMGSYIGEKTVASDNWMLYEIDVTAYVNSLISSGTWHASFALINPEESTAVTRVRSKEGSVEQSSKLVIVP